MRSIIHKFDLMWTKRIQSWPHEVRPFMRGVTHIGHPVVTVGLALVVIGTGWSWMNVPLVLAGFTVIAVMTFGSLLKISLQRPRPVSDYVLSMRFDTFSFPSGHTLGSSMAFGLLAYLAWQSVPVPWNEITTVFLLALIIGVGISRVYLGAHYPSDVMAGWLLGALGMAAIILIVLPKL